LPVVSRTGWRSQRKPNESIGVDDVKRALGSELNDVAQKLGLSKNDAAEEVA